MDPATLIVTALAAGVAEAVKDVASEEVPKAYQALKKMIVNRLQSGASMKPEAAETLVEEYEQDPETWEPGLKSKLKQAPISEDDEVVRQAQALLDLIKQSQPTSAASGDITVGPGGVVEGTEAATGNVKTSGPVDNVRSGGITLTGSVKNSKLGTGDVEVDKE